MQFNKIIGQKPVIERFINTVNKNRISHAQLLNGPEGTGKLKLAIAYAQYISCKQRTENDSCGTCPSCKKYEKLIHPDLHFVYPVVRTKKFDKPVSDNFIAEWRNFVLNNEKHQLNVWLDLLGNENSQAGIFAHESNEIIRKLSLKTFEAEYKIMIIWLPEKMNPSSANKLLKMIEEPPMKTLFLLISDFPEQIINTIRSRAQFIKIPKLDHHDLAGALEAIHNLEKSKALHIAKISNGNYFKALESIQAGEIEKYNFKMYVEIMRLCYAAKIVEITKWVDEICKLSRERQKTFISYSLRLFRENFIMNSMNGNLTDLNGLNDEEQNFSSKFFTFIHANNISGISDEFNLAYRHIERNGTDKIIFLDLSLKLVKLLRIKAA
ncbi:MAG: DNA polymerase III subunit delta [Bacteroidales bacterium]|nr:DNA polymerase III subunit delta [Bacteroidales bacterium]